MSEPFNWRAYLTVHPAADLFPLLPPDELRALADDMAANGMLSFAVADKDGNLLDGRNRLDALTLLGALEPAPDGRIRFKAGGDLIRWRILGDGDPYDQVLSLNIHRRHLTPEQKRELIAKVLKAKPGASNNSIAKQVKADDKTVAKVRRSLESTSEIPKLEKTIGADGKARRQRAKTDDREDQAEDEVQDSAGFIVAVIRNAADKSNIAVRNLDWEITGGEAAAMISEIDTLIESWELVKRKIRAKKAPAGGAE
jgi:transposase-like protein